MKILADSNMPGVAELFGRYGEVVLKPGRAITPLDLGDVDVLLVRSTTRVNEKLLSGSSVRFVGSATIGVDHVDVEWLWDCGIAFSNAPGCNARAVVEYDLAVLSTLVPHWRERHVGVVGCGNVGGALLAQLEVLQVRCAGYDPLVPPGPGLVGFDVILKSDILCLHTPLTRGGSHPTWHLFDEAVLARLAPGTVLINAGRGAVIDNRALGRRLREHNDLCVALDVWENEPDIDLGLLKYTNLATPHIAGYSLAGRLRGTAMVLDAFLAWLGEAPAPVLPSPAPQPLGRVVSLEDAILKAYPVHEDDRAMRAALGQAEVPAHAFDALRRSYRQRKEFGDYLCEPDPLTPGLAAELAAAGFIVAG